MERILPILDKLIIATLFIFVFFSMFSISVTQIACGLGAVAWFLKTSIVKPQQKQFWPLGIPFMAYALACLVSVGTAYDISYSFGSLKKLLEIFIFFWIVNCVREDRLRDSLTLCLIISASIAGLLGFYQAWERGITVLDRIEGTLSVYMTFAGLLMLVGITTLSRLIFKRPREVWLGISVVVIGICLLFTLTRQAWFGVVLGLLFLGFAWNRRYYSIFLILTCFLIFAFSDKIKTHQNFFLPKDGTFVEQLKYRIYGIISGKDYNFDVRLALWQGGWLIFKDHPLTGCGFRCVDILSSRYPDPTGFVQRYRGMHNNFIQIAVDTGIFGLTAWLGVWVCFFCLLYQRAVALKREPDSNWVVWASAASGIAFIAGGVFETNFYDSEVVMVLYFIMALPFTGTHNLKPQLNKAILN